MKKELTFGGFILVTFIFLTVIALLVIFPPENKEDSPRTTATTNSQKQNLRDYQVELVPGKSIQLWDNYRLVGEIPISRLGFNSIDSMIIDDNR